MDKLAIFNMAISLAGGRRLLPSDSAVTVEGEQCRLWYVIARDSVFRRAYWPSIRLTEALAVAAENDFLDDWAAGDPPLPWRFAYGAPAGMLGARQIDSADYSATNMPFAIEYMTISATRTRVILTNCEFAVLTYTKAAEDPVAWDNHLQLAVAHQLASHIVPALSRDITLASQAQSRANFFVAQALETQANAEEHPAPHLVENKILASRTGYYAPEPIFTSGRGQ